MFFLLGGDFHWGGGLIKKYYGGVFQITGTVAKLLKVMDEYKGG